MRRLELYRTGAAEMTVAPSWSVAPFDVGRDRESSRLPRWIDSLLDPLLFLAAEE